MNVDGLEPNRTKVNVIEEGYGLKKSKCKNGRSKIVEVHFRPLVHFPRSSTLSSLELLL